MSQPFLKCVILSKGRADTILGQTLALFPQADVTVDEAEMDAYRQVVVPERLIPHPGPAVLGTGIARIRNWILDHYQGQHEALVMLDDDILYMRAMTGWDVRYYVNPKIVGQVASVHCVDSQLMRTRRQPCCES
jgi:hypothetical protein